MKTLGELLLASIFLVLLATSGYAQCKITNAKGQELRSADCQGALLRVETDKFVYVPVTPEGFVRSDPPVVNLFFTQAFCQGEANFYSHSRSAGLFFEFAQFVDETNFYYPLFKTVGIGGSAIRSYWNGRECHDTGGAAWWDDEIAFAPVAAKPLWQFPQPPFKMAR